jgi:hypothetical protein
MSSDAQLSYTPAECRRCHARGTPRQRANGDRHRQQLGLISYVIEMRDTLRRSVGFD